MSNGAFIFIGIVRVFGVVGGCSYLTSVFIRLIRLIREQRFERRHNRLMAVCSHCGYFEVCQAAFDGTMPERGCAYFKEVA